MTIYCLNPYCKQRENKDHNIKCHSCGTSLVVKGYSLIQPLHTSEADLSISQSLSEVWEIASHKVFHDWNQDYRSEKVLKILRRWDEQSIRLFRKEVQILSFLTQQYPYENIGIPKVENPLQELKINDDPFSKQTIYCFLMQKIKGINLERWLRKNGKIDQLTALKWLKEITEILEKIHNQNLIHRDIKPSNIMLSDNNQKLVLIDLGAIGIQDIATTKVGTAYYVAPEQFTEEAVKQSDFYALGRTFVQLLTGKNPNILEKTFNKNPLAWRKKAPQISEPFADLIDKLMAYNPTERPENAKEILIRLEEIEKAIKSDFNQKIWVIRRKIISFFSWQNSILVPVFFSILISLLVVIPLESLGIFQNLELQTFDKIMNLRFNEGIDDRFLMVKITNADIDYQDSLGMKRNRASLSDEALEKLLQKLNPYQPRVIGLDIYRDFSVDQDHGYLKEQFEQNNNLIGVCKSGSKTESSIPPPTEIPKERLGFVNVPMDTDGVIRRQLLGKSVQPNSSCPTQKSFNLQIALNYLEKENKIVERKAGEDLKIDNVVFNRLKYNSGGYHLPKKETDGYQILVNYRDTQNFAREVTLQQVLENSVDDELPSLVKDKIVLIGTDANEKGFKDSHQTPYGEMQGVVVQGNMISQIISGVLEERKLLKWFNLLLERLWLLFWIFFGGILAWLLQKPQWSNSQKLVILGGGIGLLLILYLVSLLKAKWMPFYPSALGFFITYLLTIIIINFVKNQRNKYLF